MIYEPRILASAATFSLSITRPPIISDRKCINNVSLPTGISLNHGRLQTSRQSTARAKLPLWAIVASVGGRAGKGAGGSCRSPWILTGTNRQPAAFILLITITSFLSPAIRNPFPAHHPVSAPTRQPRDLAQRQGRGAWVASHVGNASAGGFSFYVSCSKSLVIMSPSSLEALLFYHISHIAFPT